MVQILRHELKKQGNETVLFLYLDQSNTEFARELGSLDDDTKGDINKSVNSYIRSKLPNLKQATVKIMVGGLLVTSFAFSPAVGGLFGGDDNRASAAEVDAEYKGFPDVSSDRESAPAIEALVKAGVIKGYPDGFHPREEISRQHAAVMFVRALKLDTENVTDPGFKDVPTTHPYYKEIAAATAAGFFNKGETFNPTNNFTRGQSASVIVRAYGLTGDTTTPFKDLAGSGHEEAIGIMYNLGLAKGTGDTFKPGNNVTREQFAMLLHRTIDAQDDVVVAPTEPPVVESVSALANTKVELSLRNAVKEAKATDYTITGADGTALEVRSATLSQDGKRVVLTTGAQTEASLYTLKAGDSTYKFVGLAADTTKPELNSAVATKNNKVTLNFSKGLDESALQAGNFTIDGLTVTNAEYAVDGNGDPIRTTVILTTTGQTQGTIYKVAVNNVTDVAGNVIDADKDEFQFGGVPVETVKPQLTSAIPVTNNTVRVTFNEDLDRASAESIANYTIDGLAVTKAELQPNKREVVLTTANQAVGTIYKLSVKDVTDDSGNVVDADFDEYQFGGQAPDTTKPQLQTAAATTNTSVSVTFNKDVDLATAQNIGNYSIPGLTVLKAERDPVNKNVVKLTTDAQTTGTLYKLTATGVTDLSGNVLDTDRDEFQFGGLAADTGKPTVVSATSIDNNRVSVTFSEAMDPVTALQAFNYNLGDLGYPTRVEKDPADREGKTYILTTKSQASKVYTVDVTGVKDLSGNVIDEDKDTANFGGKAVADTAAPKVTSSVALDSKTVQVTFNEEIDRTTVDVNNFTFAVNSGTERDGLTPVAGAKPAGFKVLDDNKTVVLQFDTPTMSSGVVYKVSVTGVKDTTGVAVNEAFDDALFAGTSAENPAPRVTSAALLNNQTLKISFSEAVTQQDLASVGDDFTITGADFSGQFVNAVMSPDGKSVTVHYTGTGDTAVFAPGNIYTVEVKPGEFRDALGLVSLSIDNDANKAKFAGGAAAAEVPKVTGITAVDRNTIDVTFNQPVNSTLTTAGADIVVLDQNGNEVTGAVEQLVRAQGTEGNTLRIFFSGDALVEGQVYKVVLNSDKVTNLNAAKITGTNNTGTFAAVGTANEAPKLSSAAMVGGKLRVTFSEKVTGVDAADFGITGGVGAVTVDGVTPVGTDGRTFDLTLGGTVNVGTIYELSLAGTADVKDEAGVGAADKSVRTTFVGQR
jgi:hypothetical protein